LNPSDMAMSCSWSLHRDAFQRDRATGVMGRPKCHLLPIRFRSFFFDFLDSLTYMVCPLVDQSSWIYLLFAMSSGFSVLVARFLHPLEHRLSCSIHIGPLSFHGYSLRPREDVERWSTVVFEFGTRQAVPLSDLERPLVTSVVFVVLLGGGGLPWPGGLRSTNTLSALYSRSPS
jgi:hypothetical protein